MTTSQRPRGGGSGKSSASKKSTRNPAAAAAKGRGTKKTSSGSKRRSTASSPKAAAARRNRPAKVAQAKPPRSGPFRFLFDGHGHDAWGLILIVAGVLAGLGIWFGMGAIVGRGINNGTGILIGLLRFVLPLVLVAAGVILIRGPRDNPAESSGAGPFEAAGAGPSDSEPPARDHTAVMPEMAHALPPRHSSPAKVLLGGVLAAFVILGLAHLALAGSANVEDDGVDAFNTAGGLLGSATAGLLAGVIGTIGTVVVLVLVGVFAVSLMSGRSIRELARWISVVTTPALAKGGGWLSGLFRISGNAGDSSADADPTSPSVRLYDQESTDDLEETLASPPEPEQQEPPTKRARKKPPPVAVLHR